MQDQCRVTAAAAPVYAVLPMHGAKSLSAGSKWTGSPAGTSYTLQPCCCDVQQPGTSSQLILQPVSMHNISAWLSLMIIAV